MFYWMRYDRNEKRTRRSMMIFLVVASTENTSRIASPFLDGSRRPGRTFKDMVNDPWVAVALESVPLRSTCRACQQTEPGAHHILVLQHTLRFEYFARQKIYILRCFLAQYFVLLSPPRTLTPPYINSLCSQGLHEKRSVEIKHHFEEKERRGFVGDNILVERPLCKNSRSARYRLI